MNHMQDKDKKNGTIIDTNKNNDTIIDTNKNDENYSN